MRSQLQTPVLFILVIAIFLASCSSPATQDDSYLTPIPESTISAYDENQDYPIDDELEAVIAARHIIATSSFILSQDVEVVSVEKTSFLDVYKRFNYGTDHLENAKIWFVVFKGSWQRNISSDGKISPLKTGCIYVSLKVNDPGRREIIGMDCLQE